MFEVCLQFERAKVALVGVLLKAGASLKSYSIGTKFGRKAHTRLH